MCTRERGGRGRGGGGCGEGGGGCGEGGGGCGEGGGGVVGKEGGGGGVVGKEGRMNQQMILCFFTEKQVTSMESDNTETKSELEDSKCDIKRLKDTYKQVNITEIPERALPGWDEGRAG